MCLKTHHPELASPPSDYDNLIISLGQKHEQEHLANFPDAVQPEYPAGDLKAGAEATRILIEQESPVIYQGVLYSEEAGLAGIPDFLIRKEDSYIIRDTKLAINLDNHPEIPLQLSLYAAAFDQGIGLAPAAIEAVLGDNTIVDIAAGNVGTISNEIAAIKQDTDEPDEAVGWTKCMQCAFGEYCWTEAKRKHDSGTVYGVDRGLRNVLISVGVDTYRKLAKMPLNELAELQRPWGKNLRRVGSQLAERIQRQVQVLINNSHQFFGSPELPTPGPCVYFDIESDPHDEVLENKVYLWGLLVDWADGSQPTYWGRLSEEGDDGDKKGWFDFLKYVEKIFKREPAIPFVHYSPYERTWVRKYIERWGDPQGIGNKIAELLWDMQRKSIHGALCLPLPSYGLKLVEDYAGFKRSQEDFGSLWSIVRYYEYLEADSEQERQRIAEELLCYNREDCEAMLHVLAWIRSEVPRA